MRKLLRYFKSLFTYQVRYQSISRPHSKDELHTALKELLEAERG